MTKICVYVHLCVCINTYFFFYKTGMIQFNAVYVSQLFMGFKVSCLLLLCQYFCFLNFLNLYFLDIRRIVFVFFFYKTLRKGKKFRKQEETHHDKVSSLLQSCKGLECCRTCWTHCKWHPQT